MWLSAVIGKMQNILKWQLDYLKKHCNSLVITFFHMHTHLINTKIEVGMKFI